jgi:putative ABC transport system permease protein
MSFLVAQRTREIGVRTALGATPAGILRMTLASAGRWTAAGVVFGIAGSLAAARVLRSLLFQVAPGDPVSVAAAGAVLCAVALAASAIPARRAARVDPNVALRQE